jgi:hypothetical protein
MITMHARVLIFIALVLSLVLIVYMVRQRSLELKYVLVWLAGDVVMIIMILFPRLMDELAGLLGIYSVVNMVFFLAFIFSIAVCFSLTVALSRLSGSVRRMAQMVSMIPDDVRKDIMEQLEQKEDEHK